MLHIEYVKTTENIKYIQQHFSTTCKYCEKAKKSCI